MEQDSEDYDQVDMTLVRNTLKEAGLFDISMSKREMMEMIQVLKNSECTATEEAERRNSRIMQEVDVLLEENEDAIVSLQELEVTTSAFIPNKSSTSKASSTNRESEIKSVSPVLFSQESNEDDVIPDSQPQTKTNIDVFNAVPATHEPFKYVLHKQKYAPPFYCDPVLLTLDPATKAKLISHFHMESLKLYSNHIRQSIFPAPWGKPISSSAACHTSLVKSEERERSNNLADSDDCVDITQAGENTEPYVSRSGRVTKRKLYDDHLSDSESELPKKVKNDYIPTPKSGSPLPKKRTNFVALKNDEIMKRSKLFSSPSRNDRIFDKLLAEESAKTMQERKMEMFQDSLHSDSDDEYYQTDEIAELVHADEPFQKHNNTNRSKSRNERLHRKNSVDSNEDITNISYKFKSVSTSRGPSTSRKQ